MLSLYTDRIVAILCDEQDDGVLEWLRDNYERTNELEQLSDYTESEHITKLKIFLELSCIRREESECDC